MKRPRLTSLYSALLRLYPSSFREHYGDVMLQTLREAHRDRPAIAASFWFSMYNDLLISIVQERMRAMQKLSREQLLYTHAALLAVAITLLGGVSYGVVQQLLRRGADQPQSQMTDQVAERLQAGSAPGQVIPQQRIDLEQSLEPFIILYDPAGRPVQGNGFLDQQLPAPPMGVFDHTRARGSNTLTWQPRRGVRIATILKRVDGPHPGFVLSGRSMRLVEDQISLLNHLSLTVWLIVLALLALSAMRLARRHPRSQPAES